MIEPIENEIGGIIMITPLCSCCKNEINGSLITDCKIYIDSPMDIKVGRIYECKSFELEKNIHYEKIKDKIKQ